MYGKPEYPEKASRSKDENQQQTQPTYDAESGNRARATLVGGKCSHVCAIPALPLIQGYFYEVYNYAGKANLKQELLLPCSFQR